MFNIFNNGKKVEVTIEGMKCKNCANRVQSELERLDNVTKVVVKLNEKKAILTYIEEINKDAIKAAIKELGYEVINIK